MFKTNRRHTEANERSARALKRLAEAEDVISKNIGELLRDDRDEESSTPPPIPRPEAVAQKSQLPPK